MAGVREPVDGRRAAGVGGAGGPVVARAALTPEEVLVVAAAATLATMVFVEGRKGALGPGAGTLLLALAVLAVLAAILHLVARVTG